MLLQQLETERKGAVIATVFSLKRNAFQTGTVLFFRENMKPLFNNEIAIQITDDAQKVIENKTTIIKHLGDDNENEILIEYINPVVALIVAGAGNDAQPLTNMADLLGWEVIICDGRATHATKKRFSEAKEIRVVKPEQFLENIQIDDQTYFVLMTHDYKYDLTVLKALLRTNCKYIGILGPKTKLNRMLDDLNSDGIILNDGQLDRIYGPIGLDIGAETSEEIALSIIAEIKAVMTGKPGTSLKYKTEKIHNSNVII